MLHIGNYLRGSSFNLWRFFFRDQVSVVLADACVESLLLAEVRCVVRGELFTMGQLVSFLSF